MECGQLGFCFIDIILFLIMGRFDFTDTGSYEGHPQNLEYSLLI